MFESLCRYEHSSKRVLLLHTLNYNQCEMLTMYFALLLSLVVTAQSEDLRGVRMTITPAGYQFQPNDASVQLLSTRSLSSSIRCARACISTLGCRTFDYDRSSSGRCRLYEADQTTGQTIASVSASIVGSVSLTSQQFTSFNQTPCSTHCSNDPYLSCSTNNTCQCAARTYWDGSMCRPQKLIGASCIGNNECRSDLGFVCLQFFQCGREYQRWR